MFTKDYQRVLTNRKFFYHELYSLQDALLISTKTLKTFETINDTNDFDEFQESNESIFYDTYIVKKSMCSVLEGVRLYDGFNFDHSITQSLEDNGKFYFLLANSNTLHFDSKEFRAEIVQSNAKIAKRMSQQFVLKTFADKPERLYIQTLNKTQTVQARNRKKEFSKGNIKQQNQIIDFTKIGYKLAQINDLTVLDEQNCLLHLGSLTFPQPLNDLFCKFDLTQGAVFWKTKARRHECFYNTVLPFCKNTYVNGSQDLQENRSFLKLYDFRTKGAVSNLLHSESESILQLERGNFLDPMFMMLCKQHKPWSLLSILSYRFGRINVPYSLDIRMPQKLQTIKLSNEENFSYIYGLHSFGDKIITIERTFDNSQGISKVVQYLHEP